MSILSIISIDIKYKQKEEIMTNDYSDNMQSSGAERPLFAALTEEVYYEQSRL